MAVEITGYLMLEKESTETLSSNRIVSYIISLDEGHDRPVWQWVKTPVRAKKSAWVPEMPGTILLDGLLMIITDGLEDPNLKSQIDPIRRGSSALVDLNSNHLGADLRPFISEALSGYKVCVVALPGSSLLKLSDELQTIGLKYRLLRQLN